MKARHRVFFGVLASIFVAAVCLLVNRWYERAARERAALDAQYQEMVYAIVKGQAGEQSPDHPMSRLYRERHDALVKAGYLKTREFRLRHPFESSSDSSAFLARFAARFPGTDCKLRARKPGEPPLFTVCAREFDVVAIKLWLIQNDTAR
jgi:hypothetical protein